MSKCQNPECNKEIEVVPGHRPRKYCDDACKQTAYRLRLEEAERQRQEAEAQRAEAQAIATLQALYSGFSAKTIMFLRKLQKDGHYNLVREIAAVIMAEQEQARQSEQEERNQLTEEIMLLGERMGYSAMTLGRLGFGAGPGDFAIMGGVDCWSNFVSHASIEMLRQARDTAYYHVEGYERARQRLKELSDQS